MGLQIWNTGDEITSTKLRQHLSLPGSKQDGQILYGRIYYDGASFLVDSGRDFAGLSTGNLSFADSFLAITVANFTSLPIVIVSRTFYSNYLVAGYSYSSTNVACVFTDFSGTLISTPDTAMDFQIYIIGI